MISALGVHTATVPRTASPLPAASAPQADVPVDAVELGAPASAVAHTSSPGRRPVFAEAAGLGLMTSGAVVGGSLGQALSVAAQEDLGKLLVELDAAGLAFARHGDPEVLHQYGDTPLGVDSVKRTILESNGRFEEERLTVSTADKKGMKFAHVRHLSELEGLEALAVKNDATLLGDRERAQTLLDLAAQGQRFFVNRDEEGSGRRVLDNLNQGFAREVGVYGAWRALNEPPPPPVSLGSTPVTVRVDHSESHRVYLSNVDPDPFSFSMRPTQLPVQIVGDNGLEEAAFFELGKPSQRLSQDPLASSIRDLAQRGVTFHNEYEDKSRTALSPLGAWRELSGSTEQLKVGVWGEGLELVTTDQLRAPQTLPSTLKDLSQFFVEHVVDKRADGRLDDRDTMMWVRAAAIPAGNLVMAQKADIIERFYASEKALGTRPEAQAFFAARNMASFSKLLEKGEDPESLIAQLTELSRRRVPPNVAGDAMAYFRETLPQITFNEQDFQTQREELVQLATMAPTFKNVLEGRELIAYTQPFGDGLALLRHAAETDGNLKAPARPTDLDNVSAILDDPPKPFEHAMADYKLVLAHKLPGEAPLETAAALRAVHTVLVPALGWESSRQAFVFLQRGSAHHAFGDKSRDEAVSTFLQNFTMRRDLEAACRAVLALGKSDAARVSTDEKTGDVIVGGIRIPRRQS